MNGLEKHLSRRQLLRLLGIGSTGAVLAACGASQTASPTQAPAAKATDAPAAPAATEVPKPTDAPAPTEASKAAAQTLIIGRGGDSVALDPAVVTDGESARVCTAVYDTLTIIEGTSTKVVPWLAESWDTKDSKVWTFKLRSGVKFHDGTECNADAVKFNFDRWMDPKNPYRYADQKYEYWDTEMSSVVDKVDVVDPSTIKISLKDPSSLLLVKLTLFNFAIASPTAIKEQKEKYATQTGKPVGTGRFKFDSWVPNDKITVVRNDDWWGNTANLAYTQKPLLEKIIWRSIPDNSTRFAEYQAGTLDMADLAQTDALTLKGNPEYTETTSPSLAVGYIAFNQAVKPFDKVEVRKAWAHAVNWDAIITTFYGEYAKRATCFQPPAILGHNPEIKAYEYSPEKAKELLKAAGLENGFETDFWYIPVVRGYFPDSKALAEAMAADLAKVGIKLNLKTEDWGAYLKDRKDGKFASWALGWGSDNGDPDNFIGYHFIWSDPTKPNIEDSYNNPKLQELLQKGRTEPDAANREKLYKQAEQIVHDDVPRIPVAWPEGVSFTKKYIKGDKPLVFRDKYELFSVEK